MKLLLDAGANPNAPDDRIATPLHKAAFFGHSECVRLLLEDGANCHKKDSQGLTPAQIAQDRGNIECEQLITPSRKK